MQEKYIKSIPHNIWVCLIRNIIKCGSVRNYFGDNQATLNKLILILLQCILVTWTSKWNKCRLENRNDLPKQTTKLLTAPYEYFINATERSEKKTKHSYTFTYSFPSCLGNLQNLKDLWKTKTVTTYQTKNNREVDGNNTLRSFLTDQNQGILQISKQLTLTC
jgi:hypothetical protein